MNAVAKGVSLGIYDKDNDRGKEAVKDGSQPYVDLMGRRYVYLPLTVYLKLKCHIECEPCGCPTSF